MKKMQLAPEGPWVSELAIGTMGMAEFYGRRCDEGAVRAIQCAMDLGVNLIDTADMYGRGLSEELVAKAIEHNPHSVLVSTKCGFVRPDDNINNMFINGDPRYIKQACENSLKRLKRDCIDLYFLHRVDSNVPVEESIGAIRDLIHEGKVRYIGLSDASQENILRAHQVHPIAAYQTEYSIWHREPELEIIQFLSDLNIKLMPYSPLGRGFLSGNIGSNQQLENDDFRKILPRFQEGNLQENMKLLEKLKRIAFESHCTTVQLSLKWLLSQPTPLIPIPGPKSAAQVYESVGACSLELEPELLETLNQAMPLYAAIGQQYPITMNAH